MGTKTAKQNTTMPSLTGGILSSAIVLCWMIAATVPAACLGSGRSRKEAISFLFSSFTGLYGGVLRSSWDAGVVDGALHLTADDIYQPPVQYPPNAKRPAGRAIIWVGPPYIDHRTDEDLLSHGASFNTSFTMSVSRSQQRNDDDGGLLLEVLPSVRDQFDRTNYYSLVRTTTSSNISVDIGTLEYYYEQSTRGVYVSIAPASTAKHTVWVDYDAVRHNLSVYIVDGSGKPKPEQAALHAPLDIDRILGGWNVTADSWRVTGGRRRIVGWLLAIALSSVLVAAISFVVAWRWSSLASWYRALMMELKLSRALRRLPGMPREFKFADVKKATRNFHESNRLGRGGFGAVYKGTILISASSDGGRQEGRLRRRYVEVAVKKFMRKEHHGYDDFLAEVAIINRLRHKNIVPLLGWCYEKGELLLIYQYMPNGSLDQHLFHRQPQPTVLPWETRYRVVADVAAALHYVHHEYERVVLHRDIKASNIMLDADFNGRLGDFGLAGLVDDADKNSLTDHAVAGTWGFIAPEYPVTHKATRQTDVYAFGVLVLEIVTGKRSLGTAGTDEFLLLTDWVWRLHGEGRLLEAVDDDLLTAAAREVDPPPDVSTRLLESADLGSELGTSTSFKLDATRLLLLGLACTNPNPTDRPSTADLVQIIAKRIAPPDVPRVKPTFLELPLLDDLDLDEDEEDPDYSNTGTLSREGLALSIGSLSLEIMVCRSRRSLPVISTSLGRPKVNCFSTNQVARAVDILILGHV
ncbi:hypothetical protein EJB05_47066, partial [Eragrostis curvula]